MYVVIGNKSKIRKLIAPKLPISPDVLLETSPGKAPVAIAMKHNGDEAADGDMKATWKGARG